MALNDVSVLNGTLNGSDVISADCISTSSPRGVMYVYIKMLRISINIKQLRAHANHRSF